MCISFLFIYFFFFTVFFGGHIHVSYFGPLVPLFWISGDISSGFQSQSGFCFICFCRSKCNVHSLRSTSGAKPTNLLIASMAAGHFSTCMSRGGNWLGIEPAITHAKDECVTGVPATRQKQRCF